jgi:hypothetical protein
MRVTRCDFCAVGGFKHTNFGGFKHWFGIVLHLYNDCPFAALRCVRRDAATPAPAPRADKLPTAA